MGCLMTTATAPPEEMVGTWKGAVTTITIYSSGEVDYYRHTDSTTSSYNVLFLFFLFFSFLFSLFSILSFLDSFFFQSKTK